MTRATIPDAARIHAVKDVLASAFEEELVLLNLNDGVYYGLEGVGTHIWSLIQRPMRVVDIRDALMAEYEVDPSRCEKDLKILLAELVDRGLAEVQSP